LVRYVDRRKAVAERAELETRLGRAGEEAPEDEDEDEESPSSSGWYESASYLPYDTASTSR
jgi:hypothetical protein